MVQQYLCKPSCCLILWVPFLDKLVLHVHYSTSHCKINFRADAPIRLSPARPTLIPFPFFSGDLTKAYLAIWVTRFTPIFFVQGRLRTQSRGQPCDLSSFLQRACLHKGKLSCTYPRRVRSMPSVTKGDSLGSWLHQIRVLEGADNVMEETRDDRIGTGSLPTEFRRLGANCSVALMMQKRSSMAQ